MLKVEFFSLARARLETALLAGHPHRGMECRQRLERFAEMGQWLTSPGRSHPGLLPLANLRFEVSRLLPAVSSESHVAIPFCHAP